MSRVLVTGASGFIGSSLWPRLVQEEDEVHCVSRHTHQETRVRWWQTDLTDPDEAAELVQRIRPDVIHHLAGLNVASKDLDAVLPVLRHNLVLTVNVLVAAVRANCELVLLAGSLEEPEPDELQPVPTSSYAAAKHAAGAYARLLAAVHGLRAVDLRIFMVYGPGQRPPKVVPAVVMPLLRRESPQLTSGLRPFDWVYVEDVVDAFVAAGKRPDLAGETIDIGSGDLVTVRALVEQIVETMESDVEPAFGAIPNRPLDERVRKADVERTGELLGWRAHTTLEEGLEATIAWCRREVQGRGPNVDPTEL